MDWQVKLKVNFLPLLITSKLCCISQVFSELGWSRGDQRRMIHVPGTSAPPTTWTSSVRSSIFWTWSSSFTSPPPPENRGRYETCHVLSHPRMSLSLFSSVPSRSHGPQSHLWICEDSSQFLFTSSFLCMFTKYPSRQDLLCHCHIDSFCDPVTHFRSPF